jgi:FMN phosphatase YigB (HAD superfamily)
MLYVNNPQYEPAPKQNPDAYITTVITDVDDILFDWLGAFRKWYARAAPDIKNLQDLFKEFPKGRIPSPIVYSFQETRYYADLPLLPGAYKGIASLYDSGKPIIAVTSCGKQFSGPRSSQLFQKIGSSVKGVYLLDHGESKKDAFMKAAEDHNLDLSRSAYIDDFYTHCISAKDAGIGFVAWQPIEHRDNIEDLPEEYKRGISIASNIDNFTQMVRYRDKGT